jgi:hypothetical protein
MSDRQSSPEDGFNMFEEPSDYFKPEPQPSFAQHTLRSGDQLQLRLVGHNPLWVGNLALRIMSQLHQHADIYRVTICGMQGAPLQTTWKTILHDMFPDEPFLNSEQALAYHLWSVLFVGQSRWSLRTILMLT